MSVCNIFKEISPNNGQGVFFTFSQYADDLTKENALQTEYRVIPKRFACLQLENHSLSGPLDDDGNVNLDKAIPQMLQDYYENVVSYYRRHNDNNNQYAWNNFDASVFLWRALKDYGLLTMEEELENDSPLYSYYNELKYVGDINIYANQDIQSTNYNEIYCMIPPEAKSGRYKLETNGNQEYLYTVAYPYTIGIGNPRRINEWFGDIASVTPNTYPTYDQTLTGLSPEPMFGYDNDDQPSNDDEYCYGLESYPMILNNWSNEPSDFVEIQDDDFFKFNSIIIFYDIVRTNSDDSIETIYRNLPLGIWLAGNVNSTDDGKLSIDNEVTKFVRSDSIFDQGTSYGLRVCTKYIATPNGNMIAGEVVDHPDNYPEFSEVCDEFADSIIHMNEILQESRAQHNELVDFISMFINKKVNVPYTKTINNREYWFVNGKNTNVIAGVSDAYIASLEQQIEDLNVLVAGLQQRMLPNPSTMEPDKEYVLIQNPDSTYGISELENQ